jgi:hypothetical protein
MNEEHAFDCLVFRAQEVCDALGIEVGNAE